MRYMISFLLFTYATITFAQSGPYGCNRSCDCITYTGESASQAAWVNFRADDHAWGNQEHSNRCNSECKKRNSNTGANYIGGSTTGVNPCYWDASKVCSVAHRSAKGNWTYWFWSDDRDERYTNLCDKGVKALAAASNGLKPTVIRQSWFLQNFNTRTVAFCHNGTYRSSGKGVEAFRNVNEKRKQAGGKGCIFDRE